MRGCKTKTPSQTNFVVRIRYHGDIRIKTQPRKKKLLRGVFTGRVPYGFPEKTSPARTDAAVAKTVNRLRCGERQRRPHVGKRHCAVLILTIRIRVFATSTLYFSVEYEYGNGKNGSENQPREIRNTKRGGDPAHFELYENRRENNGIERGYYQKRRKVRF